MTDDVVKRVKRFFHSDLSREYFTATDASISAQLRMLMNGMMREYNAQYHKVSKKLSLQMINDVNKVSKSRLFSSLKKLTGGAKIKTDFLSPKMKELMKATTEEGADLIETIPVKFLSDVSTAVYQSVTNPEAGGMEGLERKIERRLRDNVKHIHNKARNIAYDQTRKFYNNLNAERMRAVGLTKYEWVHSHAGQRPRKLHLEELDGNIYPIDGPHPIIDERTGERGIPGQAINCRCTMLPVLEFDDGEEKKI